MIKHYTFKSLLLKQMFMAIALSFAISLPITGIPAYFILKHTIASDIESIQDTSYQAIEEHLSTGWQPYNVDKVYQKLREKLPDAAFFMQKAPRFITPDDEKIDPSTPTTATLQNMISYVEKHENKIIETNVLAGTISAGFPIVFQNHCLVCHSREVQSGEIYVGALAGTVVLQTPISINQISATSILLFFALFLTLFIILATIITNRLVQANLLLPLAGLNERVKRLKVSSHEHQIDWHREPQNMVEIDEIDASISAHIQTIQDVYSKLDNLVVTEHETGLFHKERFNEVLNYELLRSHRYHHPFSIMIVKLVEVKVLNATAKNIETEQPGSKYMVFGQILHNDTRETDLAFRLDTQLFAIIAPETDEQGIQQLVTDIYHRLAKSEIPASIDSSTALPEYQFTIQVGASTYNESDKGVKTLMKTALTNMQNAVELTGKYPPAREE